MDKPEETDGVRQSAWLAVFGFGQWARLVAPGNVARHAPLAGNVQFDGQQNPCRNQKKCSTDQNFVSHVRSNCPECYPLPMLPSANDCLITLLAVSCKPQGSKSACEMEAMGLLWQ